MPPPPVAAVDRWLTAYAKDDVEAMVFDTAAPDRELVRAALIELRDVPTGTLAIALPPRPLKHELIDLDSTSEDGTRAVVSVKTTLKNPLPFASERVGHALEDMPKTRDQRRKMLVVHDGERWGVKLDLARTLERAKFVAAFQSTIAKKSFDAAEEMLKNVPPPPDEGNAQKQSDRLLETLKAELEKAKKRG